MYVLRSLMLSTLYQLRVFFRIKEAIFYGLIFPVFIFVLFGFLWGDGGRDIDYIYLILTGIIGTTVLGDGLFAVGGIIREFYASKFIKYAKKHPHGYMHFAGLVLVRVVVLSTVIIILNVVGQLLFGLPISASSLFFQFVGSLIGMFLFSALGLCISFGSIKSQGQASFNNVFYFLVIFTSSAYYPIEAFNESLATVGKWLPLEPILSVYRQEPVDYIMLISWLTLGVVGFYFLFNRFQVVR